MLKKIAIGVFFLFMVSMCFATNEMKVAPLTIASNIKVEAITIEMARMGPFGQSTFSSNQVSTEVKMDLINTGTKLAKLIAATSPIAVKVQLHQFVKKNGETVMQQINSINIQPHSQDNLSYQGVHIMLIGLKAPLIKGQKVPLTLIFSDGSYQTIQAVVG